MVKLDKDAYFLVAGIIIGAGMTAINDILKIYFAIALPHMHEIFRVTLAFVFSAAIIGALFFFLVRDWKKRRKIPRPDATPAS